MSYSVETINGCTKKLIFKFEDVNLDSQIESALKEKRKVQILKDLEKEKLL